MVKNLDRFGGRAVANWLFRIAANKARDYRAKQVAAKRGGGQVPLSLQAEDEEGNRLIDPISTLPTPDGEMMRDEKWRLVGRLCMSWVGRVGNFELRYFGDLNYQEISAEWI